MLWYLSWEVDGHSIIKTSPDFKQAEYSSTSLQKSAIRPYPEPPESNP
jgi:hypothetical protein